MRFLFGLTYSFLKHTELLSPRGSYGLGESLNTINIEPVCPAPRSPVLLMTSKRVSGAWGGCPGERKYMFGDSPQE